MKNVANKNNFERTVARDTSEMIPKRVAALAQELGSVAMRFSDVMRVPRYENGKRESDVEHSYMLALVAPEIAAALELNLDLGRLSQYAVVHDLVELKTGDIATFKISDQELEQKASIEHDALSELYAELPPHTRTLLYDYEQQLDSESRFIKFIDKLLPLVVDILGDGIRIMVEDYEVQSLAQLKECHGQLETRWSQKFGEEFPDILLAHKILAKLFEAKFEASL